MFLDPTATISISLPPGWAFDPLSSSLFNLAFLDWTGPNDRQVFVRVFHSHTDAGESDDNWETVVRSRLPADATRSERRDGPVMLVEKPGHEGRPAQRWAIVRGPRLDVIIEQVGVPLGGALMTPEIAESLRTLDVPANHHLGAPRPESEFDATMKAANAAYHAGDVQQAALGLVRARKIATESWLHSITGPSIPEVPAVIDLPGRSLDPSRGIGRGGEAMGHCVGTYVQSCLEGESFIFSVRGDDSVRMGTAELTFKVSNRHIKSTPDSHQTVQRSWQQSGLRSGSARAGSF